MARGGTDKYYNPANKVVNDGDVAYADDLNDINYAVDSAFEQIADDLDEIDLLFAQTIGTASAWATSPQGTLPDPLQPGYFSSKAYAIESKEYATNSVGVAIHKADGTTVMVDSALVSAGKAQTSANTATTQAGIAADQAGLANTARIAAELAETNAELAETNAESARDAAIIAKNAAELAETNAELAETNAEIAESLAEQWASEFEDVVVADGKYSAYHWAQKTYDEGTRVDGLIDEKANKTLLDTGAIISPAGTTAERPVGAYYYIRYNTDLNGYEGSDGSNNWGSLGGGDLNTGIGSLGFRNKIINGNFDIWQRATSQTSSGFGSDDRWGNGHSGTTKTHSRQEFTLGQTDVPGNPKHFSRTVVSSVAGAGNYCYKVQKIEGVKTFSGKTVTVSFYAKADATKNIAVSFQQFFGTGGSPSASIDGIGVKKFQLTTTWQKFVVTVNIPSISGKVLGTSGNDSLGLEIWFDAGSTYNARTDSLGQQSGTFDIAQVQVEEGSVATEFEDRPLEMEYVLCRRYFQKVFIAFRGYGVLGESSRVTSYYQPMRTVPSVANWNTSENVNTSNTWTGHLPDIAHHTLLVQHSVTGYSYITATPWLDAEV